MWDGPDVSSCGWGLAKICEGVETCPNADADEEAVWLLAMEVMVADRDDCGANSELSVSRDRRLDEDALDCDIDRVSADRTRSVSRRDVVSPSVLFPSKCCRCFSTSKSHRSYRSGSRFRARVFSATACARASVAALWKSR